MNKLTNDKVMELYLLIDNDTNELISVATSLKEKKIIESRERKAAIENHKLIISEIETCETGFSNMIETIKRNLLKKTYKITNRDVNILTYQLRLIGFKANLNSDQSLSFTDLDTGQIYDIYRFEGVVYRKFYDIYRNEVNKMLNWDLSDKCKWEKIIATYQDEI